MKTKDSSIHHGAPALITGSVYFLKTNFGLGREDCQHGVIDEFLCMVAGWELVVPWGQMYVITKVNMVLGQQGSPLTVELRIPSEQNI